MRVIVDQRNSPTHGKFEDIHSVTIALFLQTRNRRAFQKENTRFLKSPAEFFVEPVPKNRLNGGVLVEAISMHREYARRRVHDKKFADVRERLMTGEGSRWPRHWLWPDRVGLHRG